MSQIIHKYWHFPQLFWNNDGLTMKQKIYIWIYFFSGILGFVKFCIHQREWEIAVGTDLVDMLFSIFHPVMGKPFCLSIIPYSNQEALIRQEKGRIQGEDPRHFSELFWTFVVKTNNYLEFLIDPGHYFLLEALPS